MKDATLYILYSCWRWVMRRSATSTSLAPPLSAVDAMAAAAGAKSNGGVFAIV